MRQKGKEGIFDLNKETNPTSPSRPAHCYGGWFCAGVSPEGDGFPHGSGVG